MAHTAIKQIKYGVPPGRLEFGDKTGIIFTGRYAPFGRTMEFWKTFLLKGNKTPVNTKYPKLDTATNDAATQNLT